jgi:hypothetical protein
MHVDSATVKGATWNQNRCTRYSTTRKGGEKGVRFLASQGLGAAVEDATATCSAWLFVGVLKSRTWSPPSAHSTWLTSAEGV